LTWNPSEERDSIGNYLLMDMESIRGKGFRRELLAHGHGIHPRKGIPPGITSSWTWNPSEKMDFAVNYLLIDADSDWKDQNARKTLRTEAIPGLALQLLILCTANVSFLYKKFKYEDFIILIIKPDSAIFLTSYHFN
jgi:hypothetical protein